MPKMMSNKMLAKLPSERYKVLATIPEDPCFWSDWDCYAFQNAVADVEFFHNGQFELYETYETQDWRNINFGRSAKGDFKKIDGERHLIALRTPKTLAVEYRSIVTIPIQLQIDGLEADILRFEEMVSEEEVVLAQHTRSDHKPEDDGEAFRERDIEMVKDTIADLKHIIQLRQEKVNQLRREQELAQQPAKTSL